MKGLYFYMFKIERDLIKSFIKRGLIKGTSLLYKMESNKTSRS